jgi:hypothetical protein
LRGKTCVCSSAWYMIGGVVTSLGEMKLTLENVACKERKKSYSLVVVVDIKANKCEEIRIGTQTCPPTMRTRGRSESIDVTNLGLYELHKLTTHPSRKMFARVSRPLYCMTTRFTSTRVVSSCSIDASVSNFIQNFVLPHFVSTAYPLSLATE